MDWIEIIMIAAVIIGPIAAVQIEKYLQRARDSKNRKEDIFKTLMATRGAVLSYDHVEALNRIDLEFSDNKKYRKVIDAWKEYFDNLRQRVTDENITVWSSKNEELLADLLFEMGKALKYNFDKVLIKRNVYSPVGHANIERENQEIRKGLIEVLEGQRVIPMTLIQDEEVINNQQEFQKILKEYYLKNTPE